MAKSDPRVDAYIARSAEFAKPILSYFRDLVHSAVPDVEETMQWGAPHFDYKGMMLGIAAFKDHCAAHFWKGSLIGVDGYGDIKSVSDLPSKKELAALIRKLAQLNEEGVRVARPKRATKKEAKTPPALAAALKKNKKVASTFENFSPSHRREYIEWITDAKSDETRQRRINHAIAWIAEGKPRNWKYMKK